MDPRFAWLEDRVLSSLKIKPADWKKYLANDEAKFCITVCRLLMLDTPTHL